MTDTPPVKRTLNPCLKWGCCAPIAIILTLILVLFLSDYLIPSAARKALPKSATDAQEYYSGSWRGDYARWLRSKIPEADYPLFAKNLNLTERFDSTADADITKYINMGFGDELTWWTPPLADRTTYFRYDYHGGHYDLQVLKYSEGYAYFVSTSW